MSFVSRSFSAIGKLAAVGLLLLAFLAGMAVVVYMSLSGKEVKVPDIVGKDFIDSEKELASLGLKIKRRADRASADKINTVLEQLPKPGETVKTGQMILVVVSKVGASEDAPPSLKKDIDEDDTEKIEEMISDKPKKNKANSNTSKKKADTTRDVIANTSTSNSNDSGEDTSDKKDTGGDEKAKPEGDKGEKKETTPKTTGTPSTTRPSTIKPPTDEPRSKPNRP